MSENLARPGLAAAIAVHILALPFLVVGWSFDIAGLDPSGDRSELGFLYGVLGIGLWVALLVALVRWWRAGRDRLWAYAILWALGSYFLLPVFASGWLIPVCRRFMSPKMPDSKGLKSQ